MFYTIYKTTNLINGKFYIGKHQTKDLNDGYLGSGKLLKRAISKYGIENFHKEILHICKDESHMNLLESILVVPDVETNYNLCEGGKGGFSYLNANRLWKTDKHAAAAKRNAILGSKASQKKSKTDSTWRQTINKKISVGMRTKNVGRGFKNKSHTPESKNKISSGKTKRMGSNNGSYGTCWINNGIENRKIKKEELDSWFELGYNKGRKMNP